jgi:hypothetical protein
MPEVALISGRASRQSRKSLQFASLPSSSRESRIISREEKGHALLLQKELRDAKQAL